MGSRNSNSVNQKKRRGRKRKKVIIIFAVIAAVAGTLFGVTYKVFEADTIEFVGSTHYSDEELKKYIFGGDYVNLLYFRIFGQKDTKIPFIQKYDVETDWPDRLYVTVYEKAIVGYVRYMGCNMYFDKDGIVLDTSKSRVGSVPLIKGLTITQWDIGKKLSSTDKQKFQTILTITQLVEKYNLEIDGIKFTAENEIVLTHGNITIELGEGEYLAVQMMNLGNILQNLEGMSGTLYMKDFDSENATASFRKK